LILQAINYANARVPRNQVKLSHQLGITGTWKSIRYLFFDMLCGFVFTAEPPGHGTASFLAKLAVGTNGLRTLRKFGFGQVRSEKAGRCYLEWN
jgi:hypothetical protein